MGGVRLGQRAMGSCPGSSALHEGAFRLMPHWRRSVPELRHTLEGDGDLFPNRDLGSREPVRVNRPDSSLVGYHASEPGNSRLKGRLEPIAFFDEGRHLMSSLSRIESMRYHRTPRGGDCSCPALFIARGFALVACQWRQKRPEGRDHKHAENRRCHLAPSVKKSVTC